eukprot:TRINITY_DN5800_c0_g3_i4.p1 TRINITY_DN5800_c0_g3~~TRINITY_DN5800_c0_g3_i4.p1  ORF type:complete len:161 (+),score=25.94 TRINITY_DN5800_c0_g3_i4:65-547(+)
MSVFLVNDANRLQLLLSAFLLLKCFGKLTVVCRTPWARRPSLSPVGELRDSYQQRRKSMAALIPQQRAASAVDKLFEKWDVDRTSPTPKTPGHSRMSLQLDSVLDRLGVRDTDQDDDSDRANLQQPHASPGSGLLLPHVRDFPPYVNPSLFCVTHFLLFF